MLATAWHRPAPHAAATRHAHSPLQEATAKLAMKLAEGSHAETAQVDSGEGSNAGGKLLGRLVGGLGRRSAMD